MFSKKNNILLILFFFTLIISLLADEQREQIYCVGFPISDTQQYFNKINMKYSMPFNGFVVFQEGNSCIILKEFNQNENIRIPDSAILLGIYRNSTVECEAEKIVEQKYIVVGTTEVHYRFVVQPRANQKSVNVVIQHQWNTYTWKWNVEKETFSIPGNESELIIIKPEKYMKAKFIVYMYFNN